MIKIKTYHLSSLHPIAKYYLFCLLMLVISLSAGAQESTLTVIANPKGAPAEIKMSELKSVLMGEKQRWSNGTKVTIVLMKTSTAIGRIVSKKIYDMSADEVKGYWLKISFAGKADTPKFCNTAEELVSYVADNAGAIGILDKISSDATEVKTVTVDGKKSF
ncbi:MAG: hypothetical protein JWM28_2837 [Chitinophagaceae bacterium]|nr:hypothetical protein [Chitinophagaceae bacterium]